MKWLEAECSRKKCGACPTATAMSALSSRSQCVRLATREGGVDCERRAEMNVSVNASMVTTAFDLPGYRVTKTLGLVRGVTVRSRSILGTLGASLETLVGGNITLFEDMCEKAREQALDLMLEHAGEHGANAVIGVRYDATEVMQGVTEVIAYGTAVQVERAA
jgi:uncharacterized protein YbjQ (UPF0145 family)